LQEAAVAMVAYDPFGTQRGKNASGEATADRRSRAAHSDLAGLHEAAGARETNSLSTAPTRVKTMV
jgi:hypothetical protein